MTTLLAGVSLGGCGGAPCGRLADERARLVSLPAPSAGPHVALSLPYRFVNERLSARLAAIPAVPLEAPLPGLPRLKLVTRSVALQPARDDRVGFRIGLAVVDGRASLLDLDVEVEVRPVVDTERGTVGVAVQPDDLRGLAPKLGPAAKAALDDALHAVLPSAMRALGGEARGAAGALLEQAVTRAWPLLRDHLLSRLGEVARLEVSLGDLPLERVALRHDGDALRFDLWTSLPGAGGLGAPGEGPPPRQAAVRVSGATVAALGNWAMDTGRVAARYDRGGRPRADGAFRPAVRWRAGETRPLGVHVFATEGACVHARLGAVPRAAVVDEAGQTKLRVGVEAATVEAVEGPLLVELGAWLYSLWMESVSVTEDLVAETRIDLPGGAWRLALAEVRIDGDAVVMEMEVAPVDAPRRR